MPNSIFTAAVPHACGMVVVRQRDLSCAVVSLALALGLSSSAVRGQEHTEYSAADAAAGARVYGAMCLSCHGTNGAGVGGIDLRRSPLPRAGPMRRCDRW
jgi:mono/diheme cytochrome c family protein